MRRFLRPALPYLIPGLLLWLSLLLLRHQVANDMGFSTAQAIGTGGARGCLFDLVMVLMVSASAWGLWALCSLPVRAGWTLLGLFLWVASLANVLHFRFFGIPLDWWIVELHWRDIAVVQGSAAQLSLEWPVIVSGAIAALAVALGIARPLVARRLGIPSAPARPFLHSRGLALLQALAVFGVAVLLWNLPAALGEGKVGPGASVLSDNIVRQWMRQNFRQGVYAGAGTDWADNLDKKLSPDELQTPTKVLASLRDLGAPEGALAPELAAGPDWPIYTKLEGDPDESRALRRRLGLPEQGPLNVIYLFSESTRAFEMFHPEIGPEVFPRLRQTLDTHGIVFSTAYSSSFQAGQTVRGQYSTQCSMIPNLLGAAEYIAHTTARVTCIEQFLKDHGYRTTWFNSYESTFHGKRAFEQLHGMDEFYDGDYFRAHGITQQIGEWGLADKPMLQETLHKLEELAKDGRPFYANVLTISTHHPFSIIPEGPLPDDLMQYAEKAPEWVAYLSRLHYADGAITDFLDAFWKSPLADNTLIVFMGDHSTPVRPGVRLSAAQHVDVRFRIPLAFLTKNMPHPEKLSYPVHQIDVTPTVARILGLSGETTWIGRNMLQGPGSPWVYLSGQLLHYRQGDHACYATNGKRPPACYDLTGIDPLYAEPTVSAPENADQTAFFERVAYAYMRALVLNRLQPPPHEVVQAAVQP